jgi:hypothetical protein
MSTRNKARLPAGFIILDLIGTLLVLAGVFERFGPTLPGPVGQWMAGYGWLLMIAGVFCVLMAGLSLVKHIQSQRSPDLHSGSVRGPVPAVERSPRQ